MQQYCFFISNQLAQQLWLFHFFDQSVFKDVEERMRSCSVHGSQSGNFKLFVSHNRVSNRHAAFTFPSVVSLQPFLSQNMSNFISLQIQFQKIGSEIDSYGSISFSSRQTIFQSIADQSYSSAKRAVIVV